MKKRRAEIKWCLLNLAPPPLFAMRWGTVYSNRNGATYNLVRPPHLPAYGGNLSSRCSEHTVYTWCPPVTGATKKMESLPGCLSFCRRRGAKGPQTKWKVRMRSSRETKKAKPSALAAKKVGHHSSEDDGGITKNWNTEKRILNSLTHF